MNDSYRNPFSGVNAGQLDSDSILKYWCNPFVYGLFSGIKEEDIYLDSMNIVFMGGRSTGKSMFLRYWSYPIQFKKAEKERISSIEIIKRNQGIGFYFRIDGPTLKSFQGYELSEEHWSSVFIHYFELVVGRQYIDALNLLQKSSSIGDELSKSTFIPKLCELLDLPPTHSLDDIMEEFDEQIRYVDRYRGIVPFNHEPFKPKGRAFPLKSLSFGISKLMINSLPSFQDLNIVILLDEFENFLESQQIAINTLLKFTESQVKFRLGMRLEGWRTYKMITDEDFIKQGREYRAVVFEEILNKDKNYHDFLFDIAKKRLESIPTLKERNFIDIKAFLSASEDLEEEAKEIARSAPNRVYDLFSKRIPKKQLDKVRYKENPLLELLNFVWLTRGVSPEMTFKSMTDYLDKKGTEDGKKYQRDYIDKYKLSLTFLLCSIYRGNKRYYSFNTFAFLSSGIVGNFIELCRCSFAIAEWRDKHKLLQEGIIDKETQHKAAMELSRTEKQQISRIEDYGGRIAKFIENIGNVFREHHLDRGMRYPETNQFAINVDTLQDKELQNAMRAAIKWSVIQRKPKMQRSSPNSDLRDIYTINRILSPIFQISYRTRGGKSILLDEKHLSDLMYKDTIDSAQYLRSQKEKEDKNVLLNLFQDL